MIVYKMFRVKNGNLYPLYVNANGVVPIGEWLKSKPGDLADETHVKARGCGGKLSLRSGWHSTKVPFTDWIGKRRNDGTLVQRANTVWCECEVKGTEVETKTKNGYRIVPDNSYYFFKTNVKQIDPWIISDWIKINKILNDDEVATICRANGIEPQEKENN